MYRWIAFVVVLVVSLFLGYIAFQPARYEISRQLEVSAKAEAIFPFLNNSRKANDWMPWKSSDPQMKLTFSGPDEGVGSKTEWTSTGEMGTGSAEVVESELNVRVRTLLTYTQPMSMVQHADLTLTPTSNGTLVRWSVTGENQFIARLVCFFMNIEKHVGEKFETGLQTLKAMVESPA